MTFSRSTFILLTAIIAVVVTTEAYVSPPANIRSMDNTILMMAKGRKGSLKKNVAGSSGMGESNKGLGKGGNMGSSKNTNWVPVKGISSAADLPTEEDGNGIKLVDTYADALMDVGTNPNGAVCVMAFGGKTYCTDVNCSTCKIPLNKALILPPNDETGDDPRICCNFCKTTHNLRTGARLENAESAGLVGGIVKGLFSASDSAPLKTYELGEKKGQIVINLA